jgi:hypothetical protein
LKIKWLIVLGIWVLTLTLFACSAINQDTPEKQFTQQHGYTINYTASGRPYYHLMYVLDSENLLQVEDYSWQEFEENGGQFEVQLEKSVFPIHAPNCNSNLILRMPWVPPGNDLTTKYQIYKAILAVHLAQAGKVSVVLELNPYVQQTDLGIELSQCNIFFRHANSQYVPHTSSL